MQATPVSSPMLPLKPRDHPSEAHRARYKEQLQRASVSCKGGQHSNSRCRLFNHPSSSISYLGSFLETKPSPFFRGGGGNYILLFSLTYIVISSIIYIPTFQYSSPSSKNPHARKGISRSNHTLRLTMNSSNHLIPPWLYGGGESPVGRGAKSMNLF